MYQTLGGFITTYESTCSEHQPYYTGGKLRLKEVTSIACGHTEAKGQAGIFHNSVILELISFYTASLAQQHLYGTMQRWGEAAWTPTFVLRDFYLLQKT